MQIVLHVIYYNICHIFLQCLLFFSAFYTKKTLVFSTFRLYKKKKFHLFVENTAILHYFAKTKNILRSASFFDVCYFVMKKRFYDLPEQKAVLCEKNITIYCSVYIFNGSMRVLLAQNNTTSKHRSITDFYVSRVKKSQFFEPDFYN